MTVKDRSVTGDTKNRRGRPRAFDREAALEAAMTVFWRKGFVATSMADLTGAMGIASPSLYAAFGGKEALYGEAVRHYATVHGTRLWDAFGAGETAREAMANLLAASARALPEGPRGCMVTLSGVGEEGCAALGDGLRQARAEGVRRIEARLARGVAEGEIPERADRAAIARFYVTVQQGMSVQARDGATELERVAAAAMAAWEALVRT